jgi:hypothetical protein
VRLLGQCFHGGVKLGRRKAGDSGVPYFGVGGGRKAGWAGWAKRPSRPVRQLGLLG